MSEESDAGTGPSRPRLSAKGKERAESINEHSQQDLITVAINDIKSDLRETRDSNRETRDSNRETRNDVVSQSKEIFSRFETHITALMEHQDNHHRTEIENQENRHRAQMQELRENHTAQMANQDNQHRAQMEELMKILRTTLAPYTDARIIVWTNKEAKARDTIRRRQAHKAPTRLHQAPNLRGQ
ncbi:hypothetical protein Z517_02168 [Fonsecaea pedrosoi CBS 271.37]|uniref:Uncharacterized protein n=1 Tax=Fonsecaea pedrosoi CBS 271.37 TaxID=1442368 RepID=A0A0D2GWC7_9EURO|nr:uncharacterized protein Z517_02168 [Fonsecaea pedrosoi CBS 271.37]KIW82925.1 hypothetical protein Z517_02168 [Fonsecaea pedrosoi CBS 271.37]